MNRWIIDINVSRYSKTYCREQSFSYDELEYLERKALDVIFLCVIMDSIFHINCMEIAYGYLGDWDFDIQHIIDIVTQDYRIAEESRIFSQLGADDVVSINRLSADVFKIEVL